MPSRGVSFDSGLEPPPHLVGERFRSLDVLAAGGLVCVSAAAIAEPLPPPDARPEPIAVRPGDEPGVGGPGRAARARRLRAGRARRGARPVRGSGRHRRRLPGYRPRAGPRRALRRRGRGDPRVLAVHAARAPRASTPRCSIRLRAAPRPRRPGEALSRDESEVRVVVPDDLVPPLPVEPGPRLAARAPCARRGSRSSARSASSPSASLLDPLPQGQPHSFEAQRPALAARGLAEAENELQSFVRGGIRVVVAFPHRGEALRTQNLLRRVDARLIEPGDKPCRRARRRLRRLACAARLRLARARARAAPRHAGVPRAGRRAATRGSAAPCSRSPTCAPATTSSTRTTASASCSASRRRRSQA